MTTWIPTSITLTCRTCGGTCYLEQTRHYPLRLRICTHRDAREATLLPQPPCPAGEQEQRLVAADLLDQIGRDDPPTTDPRMTGYYEGRRSAARDLGARS